MTTKPTLIKKIWPLLVSMGSASVMILAFLIPSLQDQWDRYQSRRIIQQYARMGDEFVREENFTMAEQAFAKAFELSEEQRLDIEVKRLSAKVNLIYQDPVWGSKPPEGLEEVDFQFLLHLQNGPKHKRERASIMTSYGVYLATIGKPKEAEKTIHDAIRLNPREVLAYINLGNLMDEQGRRSEAEQAYRRAISLAPQNVRAHYNLGLLFLEQRKFKESEQEFSKAIQLDPHDTDAIGQRAIARKKIAN
jgi:tetratricopeptide (TPR) repeat protein